MKSVSLRRAVGILSAVFCFAQAAAADGGSANPSPGPSPNPSASPVAQVHAAIVAIGDSHSVGTFGRTLDKWLRDQLPGAQVSFYAASSSTPEYYFQGISSHGGFFQHPATGPIRGSTPGQPEAPTPKLGDLLDKTHANFTVVALGTNLLRGSAEAARPQIVRTMQLIKDKGSQCIWVGGPDERFVSRQVLAAFYDVLKSAAADQGCTLIDSRKYTHYPDAGGDGIHYDGIVVKTQSGQTINIGIPQAREWAEKVGTEIVAKVKGN